MSLNVFTLFLCMQSVNYIISFMKNLKAIKMGLHKLTHWSVFSPCLIQKVILKQTSDSENVVSWIQNKENHDNYGQASLSQPKCMQESISIFSEMQKIIYEFPKLEQTATVQCYNEQLVWKKDFFKQKRQQLIFATWEWMYSRCKESWS